MSKQSRFLCIGGFLNGTQVKDQGDSFICVENGRQVTYHKKEIFHQDAWNYDYYICEATTNQKARNWVYDIESWAEILEIKKPYNEKLLIQGTSLLLKIAKYT